jgi:carbon-monoxide dehydrogenase medium subunit
VPASARAQGSAYVKFSHPASRYAVIGVAASVTSSGGTCSAARVALGGLVSHATRAQAVEQALVGTTLDTAAIAAAAAQVGADLGSDVTGDIFASAEYRTAVAPVYVKRAIAAAAARAGLA